MKELRVMSTLNSFTILFPLLKKSLLQANKPDSVTIGRRLPPGATIIYLGPPSRTGSSCLPPTTFSAEAEKNDRTSRLAIVEVRDFDRNYPWYTWHFNPQGLSPKPVARLRRALLPHVFTLTCLRQSVGWRYSFL